VRSTRTYTGHEPQDITRTPLASTRLEAVPHAYVRGPIRGRGARRPRWRRTRGGRGWLPAAPSRHTPQPPLPRALSCVMPSADGWDEWGDDWSSKPAKPAARLEAKNAPAPFVYQPPPQPACRAPMPSSRVRVHHSNRSHINLSNRGRISLKRTRTQEQRHRQFRRLSGQHQRLWRRSTRPRPGRVWNQCHFQQCRSGRRSLPTATGRSSRCSSRCSSRSLRCSQRGHRNNTGNRWSSSRTSNSLPNAWIAKRRTERWKAHTCTR